MSDHAKSVRLDMARTLREECFDRWKGTFERDIGMTLLWLMEEHAQMLVALRCAFRESGYCHVCDDHEHAEDCPVRTDMDE